jgi:hypothetical protein
MDVVAVVHRMALTAVAGPGTFLIPLVLLVLLILLVLLVLLVVVCR